MNMGMRILKGVRPMPPTRTLNMLRPWDRLQVMSEGSQKPTPIQLIVPAHSGQPIWDARRGPGGFWGVPWRYLEAAVILRGGPVFTGGALRCHGGVPGEGPSGPLCICACVYTAYINKKN